MTARDSNMRNAFRTQLTASMGPTDTTATVGTTTGMTSPGYLVIDPRDGQKREYIYFDGAFTSTTLVTSTAGNRYLTGSAAVSGITHDIDAEVWCVPMAQHFEDLHDRLDAVISKATLDANSILYATVDDTPAALAVAASRIVGRKASGDIAALTSAEVKTLLALDTMWSKTVGVQGEIKVPSGATDYLVPFTIAVESTEVLTITEVYDAIRAGTSVTYKITKNGVDQVTGISATTTHNATDIADFTVVKGDRIAIVVTAVSGTPDGLEVTLMGSVSGID